MPTVARAVLAASSALALAALLLSGAWTGWLLAALTGVIPVALMALGAASGRAPLPGRSRALGPLLLVLAVLLAGSALAVTALSGRPGDGGFPPALIAQLAGLWLLPLPLATVGYALTFDDAGLDPDALAALAARHAEDDRR